VGDLAGGQLARVVAAILRGRAGRTEPCVVFSSCNARLRAVYPSAGTESPSSARLRSVDVALDRHRKPRPAPPCGGSSEQPGDVGGGGRFEAAAPDRYRFRRGRALEFRGLCPRRAEFAGASDRGKADVVGIARNALPTKRVGWSTDPLKLRFGPPAAQSWLLGRSKTSPRSVAHNLSKVTRRLGWPGWRESRSKQPAPSVTSLEMTACAA